MDDVETVITCPLGSDCRKVNKDDGKLYQCGWYIKMKGKDPAGDDVDQWGCAITWNPILTTEVAGAVRHTTKAVHSMRNLQDNRQKEALDILSNKDDDAKVIETE